MTISIRHSPNTVKNSNLKETPALEGETNTAWLRRVRDGRNLQGGLILLGGASVSDFRLRVSQSQMRGDLMPSFWSQTGILLDDASFSSVPLELREARISVPETNGIQVCRLADFDSPRLYPNIAVIDFTESFEPIQQNIQRIKMQRSVVDLPSLMLPWLGYLWGAGNSVNPLVSGIGIPSAVFVETVFGLAGIELTPGLSSSSSCPEAIWLTATWWQDFYEQIMGAEARESSKSEEDASSDEGSAPSEEGTQAKSFKRARAMVPTGEFALRQRAAAIVDPEDKLAEKRAAEKVADQKENQPAP